MNTYKTSNVSLAEFREFLRDEGCVEVKSSDGGHEKWTKPGLIRPVIVQTHIDPVPEFIVKNNLRNLGKTSKDFKEWLKNRQKKK